MGNTSPWAALGIAVILSGFLGAAFFSGKTYAEKKIIAKEHKALISYVEKSKAISDAYKPLFDKLAAHEGKDPVPDPIPLVLDQLPSPSR